MAYGLDAFATEDVIAYTPRYDSLQKSIFIDEHPVAYAMQWGSVPATALLSAFLSNGLVARYAMEPFTIKGTHYEAGTILLMRSDNERHPQFDATVRSIANGAVIPVSTISTGFVESGKDLGSNSYPLVRRPEVLLLSGDQTDPTGLGEVWHFFEEELNYPLHIINVSALDQMDLSRYNELVMEEGYYDFKEETMKRISDWVSSGGHLIVMGSAIKSISGKDGFSIHQNRDVKQDSLQEEERMILPKAYSSGERDYITEGIQGAVFKTRMDKSHPLSFGLGVTYWTLKTSYTSYAWLKDEQNALYLDDDPRYFGFAGAKALEKTHKSLIAGEESHGGGSVVYLVDNPLFRSFWNNGKVLFSNALFF